MTSAEVIIIGGGLNGASAAFNLARLGVKRVTRLERRHLGAGATGKSDALGRMHYTNEAKSRLARESLKVFRDFANVVGGDCGFEATGFVQIVGPAHAPALAANVAMQQRFGIDTDCETLRIVTEGGRVAGVETSRGLIAAPLVVAVPGAWAGRLLDPLGLDFGLAPYRIQVPIVRWPDGFARRHPVVIDSTRSAWIRPEGRGCTLIGVELGAGHADRTAGRSSTRSRRCPASS